MARSTYDGSSDADVQALPAAGISWRGAADHHPPDDSATVLRAMSSDSPSTYAKERFTHLRRVRHAAHVVAQPRVALVRVAVAHHQRQLCLCHACAGEHGADRLGNAGHQPVRQRLDAPRVVLRCVSRHTRTVDSMPANACAHLELRLRHRTRGAEPDDERRRYRAAAQSAARASVSCVARGMQCSGINSRRNGPLLAAAALHGLQSHARSPPHIQRADACSAVMNACRCGGAPLGP